MMKTPSPSGSRLSFLQQVGSETLSDEWIMKMYINTIELFSVLKKNEFLKFTRK